MDGEYINNQLLLDYYTCNDKKLKDLDKDSSYQPWWLNQSTPIGQQIFSDGVVSIRSFYVDITGLVIKKNIVSQRALNIIITV